MKPLLYIYNAPKSPLLRLLLFTARSLSLKLHFSLLSGGNEAVVLQQISLFPPPPQQSRRRLEGEGQFPVSRVSQLTKNVSFTLRIRSPLTELRNFRLENGQERRHRAGSSRACEPWESAELLQKESQLRYRKLDTAAMRYSLNGVMLKPHELHIVPRLNEFWRH